MAEVADIEIAFITVNKTWVILTVHCGNLLIIQGLRIGDWMHFTHPCDHDHQLEQHSSPLWKVYGVHCQFCQLVNPG